MASKTCTCTRNHYKPKYRYLKNLLAPIEEIDYFTFSNNSDDVSSNEVLPNSIFIFEDVACDKQDVIREYFAMVDTRTSTASISVRRMQRYRSILYVIKNLLILFKQNGINLKHVYNDYVNTDMSYEDFCGLSLLAAKVWICSDRQRQCAHKWTI